MFRLAADGGIVVVDQRWAWSYGWHLVLYHGPDKMTLYAHLSEMNVKVGDFVQRDQLIGRVGATGKVTGPHLHFEVRHFGKAVNPLDYLPLVSSSRGINPPPPENPKATPTAQVPEIKATPTPRAYKPSP